MCHYSHWVLSTLLTLVPELTAYVWIFNWVGSPTTNSGWRYGLGYQDPKYIHVHWPYDLYFTLSLYKGSTSTPILDMSFCTWKVLFCTWTFLFYTWIFLFLLWHGLFTVGVGKLYMCVYLCVYVYMCVLWFKLIHVWLVSLYMVVWVWVFLDVYDMVRSILVSIYMAVWVCSRYVLQSTCHLGQCFCMHDFVCILDLYVMVHVYLVSI